MIDGIGWAGKVGCLCAGCTAAVSSKLEESKDRERVCESERAKERERGRTESEKAKGGQKEGEEKKQVYLPLALQANQVSVAPR